MKEKTTRRSTLKLVSAAAMSGFAGTSLAQSNQQEITNDGYSHDVLIHNSASEPVNVSISLAGTAERGEPANEELSFSRTLNLGKSGSGADRLEFSLGSIPGGLYEVIVHANGESQESVTWGVQPGGLSQWQRLFIMVLSKNNVRIYREQI